MRGFAHILIIAMVALGGCSHESIPDPVIPSGDKLIGFTPCASTMLSRAIAVGESTITNHDLYVGAYITSTTNSYIPYTKLKYDTESSAWRYVDSNGNFINRYWPAVSSTHLTFLATYPLVSVKSNIVDKSFKFDYTVATSPNDQKDLIYALREDVASPEVAPYSVQLPFNHALTQVGFVAKRSADLTDDVTIYGVEIHNLKYKGAFTMSDDTTVDGSGTWSLLDDVDDFSAVVDSQGVVLTSGVTTEVKLSDESNVMILMPQVFSPWLTSSTIADNDTNAKGCYLKIDCKFGSDERGFIYVPLNSQNSSGVELWKAGYIVTYRLTFGKGYDENGDPNGETDPGYVTVTATLNSWVKGGDYDVEF